VKPGDRVRVVGQRLVMTVDRVVRDYPGTPDYAYVWSDRHGRVPLALAILEHVPQENH
jgi:hypothetical protein